MVIQDGVAIFLKQFMKQLTITYGVICVIICL